MALTACKIVFSIFLVAAGVAALFATKYVPNLVTMLAEKQAVLSEGSESVANFVKPPVPMYQKFYMFNLTNLDEVINGGEPSFKELGPYVFRIEPDKNVSGFEGAFMEFDAIKTFYFEPNMTKGSLEDKIVTMNPLLASLLVNPEFKPYAERLIGNRSLFMTQTVGSLLYEGFEEPLAEEAAATLYPPLPLTADGKMGYFVGKNGTSEGSYKVYTGAGGDANRMNEIREFKGKRYFETTCNIVEGTNGERFAPFQNPPESVTMFNPQLGKPWDLHQRSNESIEIAGLKTVRFRAGGDLFNSTEDMKLDGCLQISQKNFDGVFDASQYMPGAAAVYLSKPHFLDGSPELVSSITGLEPNRTAHDFYLDVYPTLGFVLDMRVRVQVNLWMEPRKAAVETKLRKLMFPIFWQEMSLKPADAEHAASVVYGKVERPKKILTGVLIAVGVVGFVAAIAVLGLSLCLRRRRSESDVNIRYDVGRSSVKVDGRF